MWAPEELMATVRHVFDSTVEDIGDIQQVCRGLAAGLFEYLAGRSCL